MVAQFPDCFKSRDADSVGRASTIAPRRLGLGSIPSSAILATRRGPAYLREFGGSPVPRTSIAGPDDVDCAPLDDADSSTWVNRRATKQAQRAARARQASR